MKIVHAIALAAVVGLSACGRSEIVQTVDWYKTHAPERNAMLGRCRANSELALTPNCVNASKAATILASERRGYVQPASTHAKIGG